MDGPPSGTPSFRQRVCEPVLAKHEKRVFVKKIAFFQLCGFTYTTVGFFAPFGGGQSRLALGFFSPSVNGHQSVAPVFFAIAGRLRRSGCGVGAVAEDLGRSRCGVGAVAGRLRRSGCGEGAVRHISCLFLLKTKKLTNKN